MQEFIEVIFRTDRTGYFINDKNLSLEPDMMIVVKVERGEEIAKIVNCSVQSAELEEKLKKKDFQKILRIATEEDMKQLERVLAKEKEAHEKFIKLEDKYPFEMKLLETVYQLDGNKLTFFFSADGRIDFRDFVRELATEFKTRIELHQTSGREDARRLGGIGPCGKAYCCVTFLKKFNQVSIKMAKDQNLLGNLSKISGPCGRLLCCLHYEEDFYLKKAQKFPEIGQEVYYNNTLMRVNKNDYFSDQITLENQDRESYIISLNEYQKIKDKKR
jgi:cell fate regulator YaaT (PSP1 superfamily)